MFRREWRDGFLDRLPLIRRGNLTIGQTGEMQNLYAALIRNDLSVDETALSRDTKLALTFGPVPAEIGIGEKTGEIEGFEIAANAIARGSIHDRLSPEDPSNRQCEAA